MSEAKYRDEEWLREQYVKKGLSAPEIADGRQFSVSVIYKWLAKYEIERRKKRDTYPRLADKEWLQEQYVKNYRPSTDIADQVGCEASTVVSWLKRHGIETRTGGKTPPQKLRDEEWVREQYEKKQKRQWEIASELNCSQTAVSNWIEKHGIEAREGGTIPTISLDDPEWLECEYIKKGRTILDISESLSCSPTKVYTALKEHGVKTRKPAHELTGEDSPRWKGGPAPYGRGWNQSKRREVRERDGHTCQDPRCSMTQREHLAKYDQKLHVHHLRKARDVNDPKERNAAENLITLCRDCHSRWEKIADTGLVPQFEQLRSDRVFEDFLQIDPEEYAESAAEAEQIADQLSV